MVDWSSVSGSAVLCARVGARGRARVVAGAGASASGSKLIGMAALLPWDDPGTLSEVGVTSKHLSAAEGGVLIC